MSLSAVTMATNSHIHYHNSNSIWSRLPSNRYFVTLLWSKCEYSPQNFQECLREDPCFRLEDLCLLFQSPNSWIAQFIQQFIISSEINNFCLINISKKVHNRHASLIFIFISTFQIHNKNFERRIFALSNYKFSVIK